METLLAVAQHRNQSYGRNGSQISDCFGASPPRGFKGISCRTFESGTGTGILPSPPHVFPSIASPRAHPQQSKRSSPIPITPKLSPKATSFNDDVSCSELWAGPAYSNSPPPSSLPIPKFSLRQKRSVSLDLPSPPASVIIRHPIAKSAPSSPSREPSSPAGSFFLSAAYATENLRRILNLDIASDD